VGDFFEKLIEYYKIDGNVTDLQHHPTSHLLCLGNSIGFFEEIPHDRFKDAFGVTWDRTLDKDIGVVEGTVLPEPTLDNYRFPDPTDSRFFADIKKQEELNSVITQADLSKNKLISNKIVVKDSMVVNLGDEVYRYDEPEEIWVNITGGEDVSLPDLTPPEIHSEHPDQVIGTDSLGQVILPDFTQDIIATDNIDSANNLSIIQVPSPGTIINSHANEVKLWVLDRAGNSAFVSFGITVQDQTSPVISSVHEDLILQADRDCRAFLPDFSKNVVATDNFTARIDLRITQVPEPYTLVSSPINPVTLEAFDEAGNSSAVTFNVYLEDNISPSIVCSEYLSGILQQGQTSYTVMENEFDPISFSDNCDNITLVNDYNQSETLANEEFPVGTTMVNWTITDGSDNKRECSSEITVSWPTSVVNKNYYDIRIYPQPVDNTLYYEYKTDIMILKIMDISGQVCKEYKNLPARGSINVSMLTKGVYIILYLILFRMKINHL
jgi:hypothetical protein